MTARQLKLFFTFLVIISFPPFFHVAFGLSSMTVGLVLAMIVLVLFFHQTSPIIRVRNATILAVVLLFLLTTHAMYFLIIDYDNKKLLAIFLFFIMLMIAAVFSNVVYKCNNLVLSRVFKLLAVIALLIGVGSFVVDPDFLNYDEAVKPVFPFSEPSHYALGFASIIFVVGIISTKVQRILLSVSIILIGVLKPSVTLLVVAFVMVVVYYIHPLKAEKIVFFAVCVVAGVTALSFFESSRLSYFYERIPFVETVESSVLHGGANLTALTYMQGWEILTDTMVSTNGLGAGLYNMEKTIPGYYGELIYKKDGRYRNRAEGSFFASKLITEFGIVGVLALVAYCALFLRSIKFFYRLERYYDNNYKSRQTACPLSLIYAHSVIVVFIVEAFVRGVGYFTTGVFLLMVAILITRRFRIMREARYVDLRASKLKRIKELEVDNSVAKLPYAEKDCAPRL